MKKKRVDIGNPNSIHPSIKKSTVKKLMKALKYFAEETRRLNMQQWGIVYPREFFRDETLPPCGTQGCIAGGILLTSNDKGIKKLLTPILKKRNEISYSEACFPTKSPELAAKILGITEMQANALFYFKGWKTGSTSGWPTKYSNAYTRSKDADGKFEATKARVFHFIETGK